MIRIGICDDDNYICNQIKDYIEQYGEEANLSFSIEQYHCGELLIRTFDKQYDILFLDIEMDGINGIETAQKIREADEKVIIVFITAILDYAPQGYKVNAFRYFVKPFHYSDFKKELAEIIKECNKHVTLLIRSENTFVQLYPEEIDFIEACGRKIYIHSLSKTIESSMPLKEMANQLDFSMFCQVHKSFIINLTKIRKYNSKEVEMKSSELVPISRHRFQEFKESYMHYWGDRMI